MIFVSVGTQLPFERLIKAMDEWAKDNSDVEIYAQIGATEYQPKHMTFSRKVTPTEYDNYFTKAKVIVSHAGMGTIITGLEANKPMVLMPRLHRLGEHRNDHQVGTAEKFSRFDLVTIVSEAAQLTSAVENCLTATVGEHSVSQPSQDLMDALARFVDA